MYKRYLLIGLLVGMHCYPIVQIARVAALLRQVGKHKRLYSSSVAWKPGVGVGVYVIDETGQLILLQKRRKNPGIGLWATAGGALEWGETIETCAKREVKEETNLDVENIELLTVVNDFFPKEGIHNIGVLVRACVVGGHLVLKEPSKSFGWQWFQRGALPDYDELFLPQQRLMDAGIDPFEQGLPIEGVAALKDRVTQLEAECDELRECIEGEREKAKLIHEAHIIAAGGLQ